MPLFVGKNTGIRRVSGRGWFSFLNSIPIGLRISAINSQKSSSKPGTLKLIFDFKLEVGLALNLNPVKKFLF